MLQYVWRNSYSSQSIFVKIIITTTGWWWLTYWYLIMLANSGPELRKLRLNNSDKTFMNGIFLTFPACFWIPINFSNLNSNCSNLYDMRNLQEQVKKAFCYQKLFWPFTVWINCSSDLKTFQPRISKFFLITVGQNNFGNKIPFLTSWRFLIFNKLEQLEFKLEKFIGI